jgi:hypothetical protein
MLGQPTAIESGFLSRSHRPVGCLACPARFERATYGLEGLKNLARQYLTMVYSALVLGVSFGSDWLGLNGVSGQGHGTDKRVSGKPTF